jgi:hypothetical protein
LRCRVVRAAGLALLALWLGYVLPVADAAHAGVVRVRPDPAGGPANELLYVAGRGESNDVAVTVEPRSNEFDNVWVVRDAGANLTPGRGCSAVDAHTIRCVGADLFDEADWGRFVLGDRRDRLAVEVRGLDYPFIVAYGGRGADRLVGSPHDDRLVGGGGRDRLRGQGGQDVLVDGDRDDGTHGAWPGPDVLDGGAGVDTVSYWRRSRPVWVNLADPAGDGGAAEDDSLLGIESIVGGRGNDRLVGDANANVIDGRRGRDLLRGRGGPDELMRGGWLVACGADEDSVVPTREQEFHGPSCEWLIGPGERFGVAESHRVPVHPDTVGHRVVRYVLSCPDYLAVPNPCSARLRVTEAGGRGRLLAEGRLPMGRWGAKPVRARLSKLGRRLVSRPRGVRAAVTLSDITVWWVDKLRPDTYRPLRWSIRLTQTAETPRPPRLRQTVIAAGFPQASTETTGRPAVPP